MNYGTFLQATPQYKCSECHLMTDSFDEAYNHFDGNHEEYILKPCFFHGGGYETMDVRIDHCQYCGGRNH